MQVIDMLMQEHQVILKRLGEFQSYDADQLAESPKLTADFIAFIRDYADHYHHAKEEEILFPWMLQKNPQFKYGPIAVMLSEHNTGRELAERLSQQLEALQGAGTPEQRLGCAAAIHKTAADLCQLLQQHIHKEDNVLYQFAENIDAQTGDGDASMLEPCLEVNQKLEELARDHLPV
ncbi:MAG: hemerythrin domain-containing protein [Pseudomonadota bacterium]|nr:hemerythrin domain-containing protein [Pseudomonadota bacterium]